MKKMNKKGFTLAELLIVIAILAVLIAVAIPVFAAQLEKAHHSVDASAERSAMSLAEAHYLLSHSDDGTLTDAGITCSFKQDSNQNLYISGCTGGKDCSKDLTGATGGDVVKSTCTCSTPTTAAKTGIGANKTLTVKVSKSGIVEPIWTPGS